MGLVMMVSLSVDADKSKGKPGLRFRSGKMPKGERSESE